MIRPCLKEWALISCGDGMDDTSMPEGVGSDIVWRGHGYDTSMPEGVGSAIVWRGHEAEQGVSGR